MVREDILMDIRAATPQDGLPVSDLASLFRERYSKDKAAIQKAAFDQRKEERKEAALTASTASHKRSAEEFSQQARQMPKKGNFRAPNTQQIPCKNWQRSGTCNYGDSCKFGHFTVDAPFRPSGGNAQPLPSQAVSYTSGTRGFQSGFQG